MADRENRGLLQAVLYDPPRADVEPLADLILMVALAEGFVDDERLSVVRAGMLGYDELRGLDARWLEDRAEELRDEAPLFTDQRAHVQRDLIDPRGRRLGLSLAAKIVSADRPLEPEERTLLETLGEAFRVPPAERERLFQPWRAAAAFVGDTGFYVSAYHDPSRPDRRTPFEVLAQARNERDFRHVLYKLSAVRGYVSRALEGAEVHGFGQLLKVGPYELRVDAHLSHDLHNYLVRCLAPEEALHPLEHGIVAALLDRLEPTTHLVVTHASDLASVDRVFLQSFDAARVAIERIER